MRDGPCRWIAAITLAMAGTASADDGVSCGERAEGDTRPRIGLVLGGGGARGIAHIGVLKQLEQAGVRVDCIAGTSMGSLVGAMYASGMPVAEIEKLVLSLDWKQMFDDSLARAERSYRRKEEDRLTLSTVGVGVRKNRLSLATGVLAGQRILLLFEQLTLPVSAIDDFDDLPIPYRAVATDLNTGEAVVIGRGSLALAMRASMSLPAIFSPAEIDGRVLLDGGLVNQVPIDVARNMGADIVIAVDVGTPLLKLDATAGLFSVVNQMTGMMTVGNTRAQLATLTERDVLIVPPLGDEVATGDFAKGELALAIGERAAADAAPRFEALAALSAGVPPPAPKPRAQTPIVEFVRLDNTTSYADEVLLSRIDIPLGKPVDHAALEQQLQQLYGFETFALVQYEVVEEEGRTGIVLRARAKTYGPNYLQAGLLLSANDDGDFGADLRTAVLFAPISPYGAEARALLQIGSEPGIAGELYWPLDPRNRYIAALRAVVESRDINVYDDAGNKVAQFEADQAALRLGMAREFGNYGAASLGYTRGTGDAEVQVGDPRSPSIDFDVGELELALTLDRLDNLYFPRDGYFARASYVVSRDALGADSDFEQANLDALYSRHVFGPHGIQAGVRYHTTIDGIAPIQSLYRLGGRTNLVGFRRNELTGQHYGVVFGGYLHELADVFGRGAFLGGTLEYGNAWQRKDDIAFDDGIFNASAYFGFDSWVGPLLFGYGAREGGEGTVFIEIGQQF